MRLLFLGDVVGKPGRKLLLDRLTDLQREWEADFTVVNVENAAAGRGVTPAIADDVLAAGADVLTTGNHVWAQREITDYIDREPRLLRPLNFPEGTPGTGIFRGHSRQGRPVAVLNLQGRVFMQPIECPFRTLDRALEELAGDAAVVLVDMHAEATSEKAAMGWYADGRVTAVLGTHTHVPTDDARVLPGGTAYCTDVGMSGPYDSVIGTRPDLAIERFLTARPVRFKVAGHNTRLAGVLVDCDPESGRASHIQTFLDPPGSLGRSDV